MNREAALEMLKSMYQQTKHFSNRGEVCFGQPFYDICKEFGIDPREVTEEE